MKNYFEKISIYLDGANIEEISSYAKNNIIKGFTTNPTLMRNAGIKDYLEFAKEACKNLTTNQFLLKYLQMILKVWKKRLKKYL